MFRVRTRLLVAALALGGLAVLAAVAVPVVSSSDVATTDIRVAAQPPAEAELAPLPSSLRPLWTAATRAAGVVLALFARGSGCGDLPALDAGPGARRWYRTVEVTTDATITPGPRVAVVAAGEQLIAVDPATGLNLW